MQIDLVMRRKLTVLLSCLMLAFSAFFLSVPAFAQQQPASEQGNRRPPIGVVDRAGIVKNSNAGKRIATALKQFGDSQKKLIEAKSKAFEEAKERLQAQKAVMEASKFEDRRREILENMQAFQAFMKGKSTEQGTLHEEVRKRVTRVLQESIAEVAAANRMMLVLDQRAPALAHAIKAMDITGEVFTLMNQKLPDVELKVVSLDGAP